jgi:hypothetical protein
MGMLDDAIREHLELKRRRGADPGEVALQERAALEPVIGDHEPAEDGEEYGETDEHVEATHADVPETTAAVGDAVETHTQPVEGDRTDQLTGQETAELDMRSVLEEELHEGPQGDPLGDEAMHAATPRPPADDDSLEWETPGDRRAEHDPGEGPPEPIPGQERLTFE